MGGGWGEGEVYVYFAPLPNPLPRGERGCFEENI